MFSIRTISKSWILSSAVAKTNSTSRRNKSNWNWQIATHCWQNEYVAWFRMTKFSGVALYWMKQLLITETIFVNTGCSLFDEHFPIVPGKKYSFQHKSYRKNPSLSACFCWDARFFWRQVAQNDIFGATVSYRDSYLEFLYCRSNVLILHAKLHDAARAVVAHIGDVRGNCYTIGRRLISCKLGHVTWLFFCLYVKLFLHSNFNSVECRRSVFCFVLDIELSDVNLIRELGVFIDEKVKGYSSRPAKKYKPTKQAFWYTTNLHGSLWNSGSSDYSEVLNVLQKDRKIVNVAIVTENLIS